MTGYLSPYKGERYHLPDFRRGSQPRGKKKEIFNHAHSSLRSQLRGLLVFGKIDGKFCDKCIVSLLVSK